MKDNTAIFKLSYGLYIISSQGADKGNAQIANTAFQITSDPMLVAVSINKENLTHEYIKSSGKVGISVLSEAAPFDFIGRFGFRSGRDIDKLDGSEVTVELGVPIVRDYSCAYLVGKVVDSLDVRSHTVFVVEIEDGDVISQEAPMTYDYYHKVLKGKAPKTAPTFGAV